jgi:ribose 1,5-bisphosphokinase PhnN
MAGDGRLELMWCDGFQERLLARGREIREVVQARMWLDLASF